MAAELFVVGISWRTAPVAIRERLAFRDEELATTLASLSGLPAVSEVMLVSTCNRVEIYGVTDGSPADAVTRAVKQFVVTDRQAAAEAAAALYEHSSTEAIRHVFRVASALDSLVLGEAQILGQLKAAFGVAGSAGSAGPILGRCLERAFGVAKRTRAETTIGRGSSNVSSVAVDLAGRVFGDLAGKSVLVVGAGKMSRLAARHLRDAGVASLTVTNRSLGRAEALAAELDAVARPWEQLEALLAAADVVICSTGAREPVLTLPLMKKVAKLRRYRSLVVIDIAVPRDADPAITKLEGIYLFDIDDLEKVVAANLAERAKAADDAATIVEAEVRQFQQWQRSVAVVPTIRALRERFAEVADAEVARTIDALSKKEHTPQQRDDAIRRLGQLIVNKLLHQPQMVLKESEGEHTDRRVEAVAALFGLERGAEPSESASGSSQNVTTTTSAEVSYSKGSA